MWTLTAGTRRGVCPRVLCRPQSWRCIAPGWALLLLLLCGLDLPPAPALPFQEGEELTFELRWLGMAVGTATLSIGQRTQLAGYDVVPLVSLAHSAPFFSTFYKVDDRVESYFDLQRLVPRLYRIRLQEGS
ncbi:MAG TPA: DUF3108 domain-containing protein, partial [Candidatus Tectomicrobia bacterium]